ncbi:MAG: hypothetical protein H7301_11065 [Cryobacterium sp.]|nr:hypothetical protein [Oligoflexia bacterium]
MTDYQQKRFKKFRPLAKLAFLSLSLVALQILLMAGKPAMAAPRGSIESRVVELYRSGEFFSPCESSSAAKKIRISLARALDDRVGNFPPLAEFRRAAFSSNDTQLSSVTLRARPHSEESSKKGWNTSFLGWGDLEREWRLIARMPMNGRWIRLRDSALEVLKNDESRISHGKWFGVTAEGIEQAPRLIQAIQSCRKIKDCAALSKQAEFENALLLTRESAALYVIFTQAKTPEAVKAALLSLERVTLPYLTYFSPSFKAPGARFQDEHTLILPLDAGSFESDEVRLGEMISKYWNQGKNRLEIEWTKSTPSQALFTFANGDSLNIPTQVNPRTQTIYLSSQGWESSPAYAVGVALGFRPRDFTLWRSDLCSYGHERRNDDLLSDMKFGTIPSATWKILRKRYAALVAHE